MQTAAAAAEKISPPPPPPRRGWETKFSQNFWASTGMTQNFSATQR
jgi:hypothetical protein